MSTATSRSETTRTISEEHIRQRQTLKLPELDLTDSTSASELDPGDHNEQDVCDNQRDSRRDDDCVGIDVGPRGMSVRRRI